MILLIANWKMAPEKSKQAIELTKKTNQIARKYKKNLSVIVCPPSIHILPVSKNMKSAILGSQGVSALESIAQTGLVSAGMLKDYGTKYCIVGHSEMRLRGDTNETVEDQVLRLLEKKITPIICVGETQRDTHGWYLSSIKDQIEIAIGGIPKALIKNIVIAYEPIWAIGANAKREATPVECQEIIIYIRKIISDIHGEKNASQVKIVYGGSVNENNANSFIEDGKAQGLLVGRSSLDIKSFTKIADSIKNTK